MPGSRTMIHLLSALRMTDQTWKGCQKNSANLFINTAENHAPAFGLIRLKRYLWWKSGSRVNGSSQGLARAALCLRRFWRKIWYRKFVETRARSPQSKDALSGEREAQPESASPQKPGGEDPPAFMFCQMFPERQFPIVISALPLSRESLTPMTRPT